MSYTFSSFLGIGGIDGPAEDGGWNMREAGTGNIAGHEREVRDDGMPDEGRGGGCHGGVRN